MQVDETHAPGKGSDGIGELFFPAGVSELLFAALTQGVDVSPQCGTQRARISVPVAVLLRCHLRTPLLLYEACIAAESFCKTRELPVPRRSRPALKISIAETGNAGQGVPVPDFHPSGFPL